MRALVTSTTDAGFDSVVLTLGTNALTDLQEQDAVTWWDSRVTWKPAQWETTLEEAELQLGPNSSTSLDEEPESWVDMVVDRARKLCDLPRGWDGCGSPPPSPRIVRAAEDLFERLRDVIPTELADPFVCPVSGGGVQIEITSHTKHLELMFDAPSSIVFLKEEGTGEEETMEAGEVRAHDVPSIRRLFEWFASA